MKNWDPKESITLKMICYFLIPILVVIIGFNIFCIIYQYQNPQMQKQSYFESEKFSQKYLNFIYESQGKINKSNYYFTSITNDLDEVIYYEAEDTSSNFSYLIIDDQAAYTNLKCTMQTDSIDKIKELIAQKGYYWDFNSIDGETTINVSVDKAEKEFEKIILEKQEELRGSSNISTNIENLNLNNTRYTPLYKILNEKNITVYISLNKEMSIKDEFYYDHLLYTFIRTLDKASYISMIVFIILLFIIMVYLIQSLGYKRGEKGIYLNWWDKIPLEILGLIYGIIFLVTAMIGIESSYWGNGIGDTALLISSLIVFYSNTMLVISTGIKRIKTKTFFKNSITYRILEKLNRASKTVVARLDITFKLGLVYSSFLGGLFLVFVVFNGTPLLLFGFILYVGIAFYYLLKYVHNLLKIRNCLKSVYEGEVNEKLNIQEFKGELKQVAIYVNDIAGGFSNAIEENLKSERLKTELITNVSHDIKTPLTSIINYVDLLKKENIQNEKANEYIQVLDNKSQRLKKLTEDLVEASKAASGNIKLNIEKINICELTMQATGEFEDRFNKRGLQIITQIPEEEIQIHADSRYMYRIYENLLNNIAKYALENSRVYIDIIKVNSKVIITFKNISQDKLNISADELIQRFVRGDESRTTEGSGLGLAITKSLTQIQKGEFNMYLDGDLFKIVLEFQEIE